MSSVDILYGIEFWNFLENALSSASRHVFILSGYARNADLAEVMQKISQLPHLVVVRDDNSNISNYPDNNLILTRGNTFHAKVYIIDDYIIVGSQNLYKVTSIPLEEKVGEVSIGFQSNDSLTLLYQSLMLILEKEYEKYYSEKLEEFEEELIDLPFEERWKPFFRQYRLESFLNLDARNCPCCNGRMTYEESDENIIDCNTYGDQLESECGDGNACKYCCERIIKKPQHQYSCDTCNFKVGYSLRVFPKRAYWKYIEMVYLNSPRDLNQFFKLYFYLVEKLGKQRTDSLLIELDIIGNIGRFDVNSRILHILEHGSD